MSEWNKSCSEVVSFEFLYNSKVVFKCQEKIVAIHFLKLSCLIVWLNASAAKTRPNWFAISNFWFELGQKFWLIRVELVEFFWRHYSTAANPVNEGWNFDKMKCNNFNLVFEDSFTNNFQSFPLRFFFPRLRLQKGLDPIFFCVTPFSDFASKCKMHIQMQLFHSFHQASELTHT